MCILINSLTTSMLLFAGDHKSPRKTDFSQHDDFLIEDLNNHLNSLTETQIFYTTSITTIRIRCQGIAQI